MFDATRIRLLVSLGLAVAFLDAAGGLTESVRDITRSLPLFWLATLLYVVLTVAVGLLVSLGAQLVRRRASSSPWVLALSACALAFHLDSAMAPRALAGVGAVTAAVAVFFGYPLLSRLSREILTALLCLTASIPITSFLIVGRSPETWRPFFVASFVAALGIGVALGRLAHRKSAAYGLLLGAGVGLVGSTVIPAWNSPWVVETTAGKHLEETQRAGDAPSRPSILLLTVDTLRHAEASDPSVAPELAEFLGSSIRFPRAYSTSPWTKPSFLSVHGSTHVAGSRRLALREDAVTLAGALKKGGYSTAAISANPIIGLSTGVYRGFDDVTLLEYSRLSSDLFVSTHPALQGLTSALAFAWFRPERLILDTTDRVLSLFEDKLGSSPRDRPVFFWVHFCDPHDPYVRAGAEPAAAGGAVFAPKDPRFGTASRTEIRDGTARLSPEDKRWIQALYRAEVAKVGRAASRVIERFEQHYPESVILLTSDHGEEFWEHGSYYHGHSLYEELVRVPLAVKVPGEPARDVSGAVSLVDVAPTLAGAVGIEPDAGWQGNDLLRAGRVVAPVFLGANSYGDALRAVVSDGFKLIVDSENQPFEMYDLEADPGERRNVVESLPEKAQELLSLLAKMPGGDGPGHDEESDAQENLDRLRTLGYIQ